MKRIRSDNGVLLISCPHVLQEFIHCNDETAVEFSRLIYEISLVPFARWGANDSARALFDALIDYDVVALPDDRNWIGITLARMERGYLFQDEPDYKTNTDEEGVSCFLKYLQETPKEVAFIPVPYLTCVSRAFGEFAGVEVDPRLYTTYQTLDEQRVTATCGFCYHDMRDRPVYSE